MKSKLIWNLAIVGVAIVTGIMLSLKPWQVYNDQRKLAAEAVSDMRVAEGKRAELTRQRAKYESAIGREELARKQGYRRPDETPIGE